MSSWRSRQTKLEPIGTSLLRRLLQTLKVESFLEQMFYRICFAESLPYPPNHEFFFSDCITKSIMTPTSSTMRVAEPGGCEVGNGIKENRSVLLMGIQTPITCQFSGDTFHQWRTSKPHSSNYIGILTLAWSYILSARLLELQKHDGAELIYTSSTANSRRVDGVDRDEVKRSPPIEVHIGEAESNVARWWMAILAPQQGWKAVLTKRNDNVYLAPWSIDLGEDELFEILWQGIGTSVPEFADCFPLSSGEALTALSEFCLLHGLGDQFFGAFAAALTFPTNQHYKRRIELPSPTIVPGRVEIISDKALGNEYITLGDDLAYYMALSCNPSVVMSSLSGSFWEPGVPCNLVNSWLHPVVEELPTRPELAEAPGRYIELITLMCGIRRPGLSALWVGAALSGLVPKVIDLAKSGTPPLDPSGFAWTSSAQNFMDFAGSGPYFAYDEYGGYAIKRADAWRLLYLPVTEDDGLHYNSLPFSPWPPIGQTKEKNCALRVQKHKKCSRHTLAYLDWAWQLHDSTILHDRGFRLQNPTIPHPDQSNMSQMKSSFSQLNTPLCLMQDASREASLEIFRWVLANHEGKPSSEPIYEDSWIAGCDDTDESDAEVESIANSDLDASYTGSPLGSSSANPITTPRESRIRQWVDNISSPDLPEYEVSHETS